MRAGELQKRKGTLTTAHNFEDITRFPERGVSLLLRGPPRALVATTVPHAPRADMLYITVTTAAVTVARVVPVTAGPAPSLSGPCDQISCHGVFPAGRTRQIRRQFNRQPPLPHDVGEIKHRNASGFSALRSA